MKQLESFKIIGIQVETTNENGKATADIGKLWEQFYADNIPSIIPNVVSEEVYSIYTDYETDYKGKYTTVLGMKVNSLDQIPTGLVGRKFSGGKYRQFIAKGKMPDAVVDTWNEIWVNDKELNRKYTADFEVYGPKSQDGENAEVAIYIAIE